MDKIDTFTVIFMIFMAGVLMSTCIAVIVALAASAFGIAFPFLRLRAQTERLRPPGEVAPATILNMRQGSLRITTRGVQEEWQAHLLMQIRPASGMTYQAEATHLISVLDIPQFQPEATVLVKIDPKDRNQVTVLTSLGNLTNTIQAPGQDAAVAQEMVVKSQILGYELAARGESAQAQVLNVEETGVLVYGNNPFLKFRMDVRPEKRATFSAEASGPISQQNVPKFQPGSMIWVRFDPQDTTKVAIERSA